MTTLRIPFLIAICLIFVTFPQAKAQENIALSHPGSLTLFRPFTNNDDEGVFTNLPLRLSVLASVGYDDNVFTTHDHTKGSGFDELSLGIGSHIGNQRTRFDADLSLGMIYYWSRPGNKIDPDISLNLSFTHEFNPRLVLGITSFMAYQQQPDFSLGIGQLNNVGNYFTTIDSITLGYQWTRRFSTVTSYTLSTYTYSESAVADQENRFEHLFGQQFRYQLYPTVTVVLEYRFGYIQYETANTNSYSQYALGGADFTLSPKLTFTFRAGAEFRHFLGDFSGDATYPYFESTLAYEYLPRSFIRWYNRYGLEQSDFGIASQSKQTYRTGLQISHSFGSKLKAELGIYYSNDQYDAPISNTDNAVDVNASVSYAVTRKFSVQAGYTYTRVFSQIVTQDYARNRVYLGASYAF
jgi:hypothetical protein